MHLHNSCYGRAWKGSSRTYFLINFLYRIISPPWKSFQVAPIACSVWLSLINGIKCSQLSLGVTYSSHDIPMQEFCRNSALEERRFPSKWLNATELPVNCWNYSTAKQSLCKLHSCSALIADKTLLIQVIPSMSNKNVNCEACKSRA